MYFDACHQDVRERELEVCCCGSYMKEHGWYDGHSPVSSWDYARDCYVRDSVKGMR